MKYDKMYIAGAIFRSKLLRTAVVRLIMTALSFSAMMAGIYAAWGYVSAKFDTESLLAGAAIAVIILAILYILTWLVSFRKGLSWDS